MSIMPFTVVNLMYGWFITDKGGIAPIVVGIFVVSIIIIISLPVALTYVFLKRRRKAKGEIRRKQELKDVGDEIETVESLQFDFSTIKNSIDDFSIGNKLGEGGFGSVYKGRLLNGQDIALKRLPRDSGQEDLEFNNEVLLVAKLHHRNLIRLRGFYLEDKERLLIYEFVSNSSLDNFIFDLGKAKFFEVDQTRGSTSRIVGTFGYMTPEYVKYGHFSVKSDVFSFGVLVLEIISGQKNSRFCNGEEGEDLLTYAWRNWKKGTALNMIDHTLSGHSSSEITRCIHVGLLCVQENDRPTMTSVVLMLTSNSFSLSVPSKPAFFMHSVLEQDKSEVTMPGQSKSNSVQYSVNEASVTELDPR